MHPHDSWSLPVIHTSLRAFRYDDDESGYEDNESVVPDRLDLHFRFSAADSDDQVDSGNDEEDLELAALRRSAEDRYRHLIALRDESHKQLRSDRTVAQKVEYFHSVGPLLSTPTLATREPDLSSSPATALTIQTNRETSSRPSYPTTASHSCPSILSTLASAPPVQCAMTPITQVMRQF